MTIVEADRAVTGGVDTHADVHVAAALDPIGGLLGVESFAATTAGYAQLTEWMAAFGPIAKVGVEGSGAYGAGLARFLRRAGIEVIEVDRANRQARRQHGKSDPADALEAARAAQGGRAQGIAKSRDGTVEAIRALTVARRSAQHTRIAALNQMRQLCFTAPDEIRDRFRGSSAAAFAEQTAALRPRPGPDPVTFATYTTLRTLGRRVRYLEEELARVDRLLGELVSPYAPALMALRGVGVQTAAILVVAAGDNPERVRTEAAWAHLCGVAPIEASSGKVTRHRLDRGGNRQANKALWTIVMVRMSSDAQTRAYVERRTKDGRSKREIIRVLKRYVAREVYRHLPRS
jgi:transposase